MSESSEARAGWKTSSKRSTGAVGSGKWKSVGAKSGSDQVDVSQCDLMQ